MGGRFGLLNEGYVVGMTSRSLMPNREKRKAPALRVSGSLDIVLFCDPCSTGLLSRRTNGCDSLTPPFPPRLDYWAAALKVGASLRRSSPQHPCALGCSDVALWHLALTSRAGGCGTISSGMCQADSGAAEWRRQSLGGGLRRREGRGDEGSGDRQKIR